MHYLDTVFVRDLTDTGHLGPCTLPGRFSGVYGDVVATRFSVLYFNDLYCSLLYCTAYLCLYYVRITLDLGWSVLVSVSPLVLITTVSPLVLITQSVTARYLGSRYASVLYGLVLYCSKRACTLFLLYYTICTVFGSLWSVETMFIVHLPNH